MLACVDSTDIMHGQYAGRNLSVVVDVINSIANNFYFVESLGKAHGDGKPLNFVVCAQHQDEGDDEGPSSVARTRQKKSTKMIDFDASASYGKRPAKYP